MVRFIQILIFVGVIIGGGFAAWFFFVVPGNEREAAERQAFDQKVSGLEARIEAGSAPAMTQLAEVYLSPDSLGHDPEQGVRYLFQAAKAGNPKGQFLLGRTFAEGELLGQSYPEAAKWYRSAAIIGSYGPAYFELGELHNSGRGVVHDLALAFDYYVEAAERGHPIAQYLVGLMHKEGWVVRTNPVKALKWVLLALPHQDRVQRYNSTYIPEETRDELVAQMNTTQINEGRRMADAFVPRR